MEPEGTSEASSHVKLNRKFESVESVATISASGSMDPLDSLTTRTTRFGHFVLECHNELRKFHLDTPSLTWSDECALSAQTIVEHMALNNTLKTYPTNQYGQNVAFYMAVNLAIESDKKDLPLLSSSSLPSSSLSPLLSSTFASTPTQTTANCEVSSNNNSSKGSSSDQQAAVAEKQIELSERILAESTCEMWYSEREHYDYENPGFNVGGTVTSHFSQVVWRSTRQVGAAKLTRDGRTFVVAIYKPPGNVEGTYSTNVIAPQ